MLSTITCPGNMWGQFLFCIYTLIFWLLPLSLKSTGHQLLVWLIGVLIHQDTPGSLDTQVLVCLKELLRVTQGMEVYNIAQDNVGGGHQLRFYRGAVDKLLEQRYVACLERQFLWRLILSFIFSTPDCPNLVVGLSIEIPVCGNHVVQAKDFLLSSV